MQTVRAYLAVTAAALAAAGCGGGSTSPTRTGVSGIAVPQEISALPATTSSPGPTLQKSAWLGQVQSALDAADLPATSDYQLAPTFRFVDERSLSQFSILNTIFSAMAQTHYADAENVGAGPYGAMVAWVEDKDGSSSKQIKSWVVNSTMDGGVNHVQAWMRDMMDNGGPDGMIPPPVIKADLEIRDAPIQNADGSYADYGVWMLSVSFEDADGQAFFLASSTRVAPGVSEVKLYQHFPGEVVRGILHKSEAAGFGQVTYPDWSQCDHDGCVALPVTVAYAYDAHHVALQKGSDPVLYKDRQSVIDIVNRYGLYDAVTGEDVAAQYQFGFPFTYTVNGAVKYGYYSAWQGRHQIWGNGSSIPAGITVTRADHHPGQPVETYTTSPVYTGTLVKRTLQDASVQDLKDVVVQTWDNQWWQLVYDGSQWRRCEGWLQTIWNNGQPQVVCSSGATNTPIDQLATETLSASYQSNPAAGYQVNLNACNQGPCVQLHCVSGQLQDAGTGQAWTPSTNAVMSANTSGPIWLVFDGSVWKRKNVTQFDQQTWTPTFTSPDLDYTFPLHRDLYLNNMGVNYVVQHVDATGDAAYPTQVEIQAVANPLNAATLVPDGTVFTAQGGPGGATFRFVTDPASASFLTLVYGEGSMQGQPVTSGMWGLQATIGGATVQFNWDYPMGNCQGCGQQQFLKSGSTYVTLHDPIRLAPITLTDGGGNSHTYALSFDGQWMSGLPNLYPELQASHYVVTPEIQAKVVAVDSGQWVADATGSASYLVKQLQVSQYLAAIADPGDLDLTEANLLDLSSMPTFSGTSMGTIPNVGVKYSEGVLVQ